MSRHCPLLEDRDCTFVSVRQIGCPVASRSRQEDFAKEAASTVSRKVRVNNWAVQLCQLRVASRLDSKVPSEHAKNPGAVRTPTRIPTGANSLNHGGRTRSKIPWIHVPVMAEVAAVAYSAVFRVQTYSVTQ